MESSDNKLTINQVAELCGVSKTTVSRFLNGKYANMSDETRARIQAVIAELDYRPNRSAQRLKSSRSMLIGCVIGDVGSPFSAILLRGIANACEEAGYQVLFADSRENPKREKRVIEGFLENKIDGLIVNTTGGNDELLVEINRSRLPIVLVDRLISDNSLPSVSSPNFETAYDCTRMLFDMGYEYVAFVSEENRMLTPRVNRRRGYAAAAENFGREPLCFELDPNDLSSCDAFISSFVSAHPGHRLAVLCANGVSAQHVLMSFNRFDITSGYDFGLCTFDDWNWLQLAKPGITTVQLGTEEKGTAAAKLLIDRINGGARGEAKHIEVPTRILVRASTCRDPEKGK